MRAQRLECRQPRADHRRRVIEGGPVVALVELDQHLARLDVLVVRDWDLSHETGDVRRDGGERCRRDIRVVGALYEAPVVPPLVATYQAAPVRMASATPARARRRGPNRRAACRAGRLVLVGAASVSLARTVLGHGCPPLAVWRVRLWW